MMKTKQQNLQVNIMCESVCTKVLVYVCRTQKIKCVKDLCIECTRKVECIVFASSFT